MLRKEISFLSGMSCLIVSKKVGENVKTYLLRLNQLAKHCRFKRADSDDMTREEWVSQTFLAGLSSCNMRTKILENELTYAKDVYDLAMVVERSKEESSQYDSSGTQDVKLERASKRPGNHGNICWSLLSWLIACKILSLGNPSANILTVSTFSTTEINPR